MKIPTHIIFAYFKHNEKNLLILFTSHTTHENIFVAVKKIEILELFSTIKKIMQVSQRSHVEWAKKMFLVYKQLTNFEWLRRKSFYNKV